MQLVLIVDDEFGIAEALRDLLQDEGYRTAIAINGRQALERMREERPDLILLDYMMPVMNGAAVIAEMQADPKLRDIKVIVMSASSASAWKDLPAAGRISKPFDLEHLLGLIRKLIS